MQSFHATKLIWALIFGNHIGVVWSGLVTWSLEALVCYDLCEWITIVSNDFHMSFNFVLSIRSTICMWSFHERKSNVIVNEWVCDNQSSNGCNYYILWASILYIKRWIFCDWILHVVISHIFVSNIDYWRDVRVLKYN